MKKEEHINKLVNEAMKSLDHIERASPRPFLLTRIHARLNSARDTGWEKLVRFVGRPVVAVPGLAMLIFVNVMVVVVNRAERLTPSEQSLQAGADDFSYAVSSIYDIESNEP